MVLLSAQGGRFDQAAAERLSESPELLLICGRYEGVDERVATHLADEELSIGDYVLSGGELAAAVVIDVIARRMPGVLGNEDSAVMESFSQGGPDSGLSAVYAAGRFSRSSRSGSVVERESRADPPLAAAGGAGEDGQAAAGPSARKPSRDV